MKSQAIDLGLGIRLEAPTMGGVHYGFAPTGAMARSNFASPIPRAAIRPAPEVEARQEASLGDTFHRQGRFKEAIKHLTNAVALQPAVAEYYYRLGLAHWSNGDVALVVGFLNKALSLDPKYLVARQGLALLYLQEDDCAKALIHADAALALNPTSEDAHITRADVLCGMGQVEKAYQQLKPLIDRRITSPFLARTLGKIAIKKPACAAEAIVVIESAQKISDLPARDRAHLHSVLSGLLEKLNRHDEAFAQCRLCHAAIPHTYDPNTSRNNANSTIAYFTRERFNSLPRATHNDQRPVFIIGMPRSGTSLVEQIIASHPAVHGAGELPDLSQIITEMPAAPWARNLQFPFCFDHLSSGQANQLAAQYLKALNERGTSATFITDKMPQNYYLLGAVQVLFPGARIIHCRRDPRDTCLSCYMTNFLSGQDYAHDLGNLANYYRDYQALMAHWKSVLDLPILDVQYEDLVNNQEPQTRRMLDFLGLAWDDRCRNFHKTERSTATASREQVRKPIYRTSIGRWKSYAKHIPELLALTEPNAE